MSCSFSLVREDALERIGWPSVELTELSIEAKLDLIAAQIVNYGEGKADVSEAVLEWARATWAMSTQIHSLSRRKEP